MDVGVTLAVIRGQVRGDEVNAGADVLFLQTLFIVDRSTADVVSAF
jgi:hypothetical protein